jgi:hypothetical protein
MKFAPIQQLTRKAYLAIALLVVFNLFLPVRVVPAHAVAGINPQINFQGKLTDASGNAVADGPQDIVYKLYTVPSGGSALWTETWNGSTRFSSALSATASIGSTSLGYINDASESNLAMGDELYNNTSKDEAVIVGFDMVANTVTTTPLAKTWNINDAITTRISSRSGLVSVRLGSVTSLAAVDFNQDTLYVGISVGTDPEMSPRKRLASVPQAFNSQALGGVTSTQFLRSDTPTTLTTSSTNAALSILQGIGTNAGAALKVLSAPIANSVASLLQLSLNSLINGNIGGTFIGANPSAFSGDFMNFQVNGASKFGVDSMGSVTSAGMFAFSGTGSNSLGGPLAMASNINWNNGISLLKNLGGMNNSIGFNFGGPSTFGTTPDNWYFNRFGNGNAKIFQGSDTNFDSWIIGGYTNLRLGVTNSGGNPPSSTSTQFTNIAAGAVTLNDQALTVSSAHPFVIPAVLQGSVGQGTGLLRIQNSSGNELFSVTSTGSVTSAGAFTFNGSTTSTIAGNLVIGQWSATSHEVIISQADGAVISSNIQQLLISHSAAAPIRMWEFSLIIIILRRATRAEVL